MALIRWFQTIVGEWKRNIPLKTWRIFKKEMVDIRGTFLQLLSNRDQIIELLEMYHSASLEYERDIDKITHDLDTTHDSLKNTQSGIWESKIQIKQLLEKMERSHFISYI